MTDFFTMVAVLAVSIYVIPFVYLLCTKQARHNRRRRRTSERRDHYRTSIAIGRQSRGAE